MIKLKDLLLEGTVDTKAIAIELLRAATQATRSKAPKGFGGFGIAWDTKYKGVFILYDTPREVRHPEDYGDEMEHSPEVEKWYDFTDAVFGVISKFEKKYKGVEFGVMGDTSGPGIKHGRRPGPSHL